jgi:hypothetical protein
VNFVELRGFSLVSFQLNFNFCASSVSFSCESLIAKRIPRMERLRIEAVLTSFNIQTLVWLIRGKAIPLQAWTGTEGSRRLRLPDFKTIDT